MKGWRRKTIAEKAFFWGGGVLLFAAAALCFFLYGQSRKATYSVLFLGDSIVGNVRDETSIPALLGRQLGTEVFNGGFGGMTLAYRNRENRPDAQEDCLSLTGILQSLVREDFYWQTGSIGSVSYLDYFPGAVREMSRIDWDGVDILLIEYGVNDYLTGVPLENGEDRYDRYTFGGALRSALALIKKNNPEKRIVLCTPTYCWFPEEGTDCGEKNTGYGVLGDYVELELEIASEFGVEVIDNYRESAVGNDGGGWETYTVDGLHLNGTGRSHIAGRIARFLTAGETGENVKGGGVRGKQDGT